MAEPLDPQVRSALEALSFHAITGPEGGPFTRHDAKNLIDYFATRTLPAEQDSLVERLREAIRAYAKAVARDTADQYADRKPEGHWKPAWEAVQAALDALFQPEPPRTVAWLIERRNFNGSAQPHWFAEDDRGIHDWVPDANLAKRFPTEKAAGAFPAYKMIASDPDISLTEHVFLDRAALFRPKAETEPADFMSLAAHLAKINNGRPTIERESDGAVFVSRDVAIEAMQALRAAPSATPQTEAVGQNDALPEYDATSPLSVATHVYAQVEQTIMSLHPLPEQSRDALLSVIGHFKKLGLAALARAATPQPDTGMVMGDQTRVVLIDREDGGLSVRSPDLPGLILSGRDPAKVAASIPIAIKALRSHVAAPPIEPERQT